MPEKERQFNFTLLGQEYSVVTGASEEEMKAVLHLVRDVVENGGGAERQRTVSINKKAVLACLTIASKYLALKQDFENYRKDKEVRSFILNKKIDGHLRTEKSD